MSQILITTSSFDQENNDALKSLRGAGLAVRMNPYGRRLTETEVGDLLAGADVVGMIAGVEPLTGGTLRRASSLKVISRCGTGMDSIDVAAATGLGIKVFSTPEAPVTAVAELTLALILDLLRYVAQADRNIRNGNWKQFMGCLLASQTIGIVGFGRIGRRVGELAHAFGARIRVHDKAVVTVPAYAKTCRLEELLKQSDIVTLHALLEPGTGYLIGGSELKKMKRGAFLVNTARGGLVDEDALRDALVSGHLAGAALDTYQQEPYSGPLARLSQVLLTAHMGSYAKEARAQMEREAAENLLRGLVDAGVLEGKTKRSG